MKKNITDDQEYIKFSIAVDRLIFKSTDDIEWKGKINDEIDEALSLKRIIIQRM